MSSEDIQQERNRVYLALARARAAHRPPTRRGVVGWIQLQLRRRRERLSRQRDEEAGRILRNME